MRSRTAPPRRSAAHKSDDTTLLRLPEVEALPSTTVLPQWYDRAVGPRAQSRQAADGKIGIPVFTPGRFRHSIATWAFEAGADPFAVSAFLGHKSPSTTKKFYAALATVPKVPTLA
jgi:integrase